MLIHHFQIDTNMHLFTPPPPSPQKRIHNHDLRFWGDDCNTQEMVTVVMQNLGEAWGKQYGLFEKIVFRPPRDSKENLPLSLY